MIVQHYGKMESSHFSVSRPWTKDKMDHQYRIEITRDKTSLRKGRLEINRLNFIAYIILCIIWILWSVNRVFNFFSKCLSAQFCIIGLFIMHKFVLLRGTEIITMIMKFDLLKGESMLAAKKYRARETEKH